MDPQWIARYKPVTALFMDYGWFVAPFMVGYEFDIVVKTADYIRANPPKDDAGRREIENIIYRALEGPAFHPGYRARATWVGNRLKHARDFNHIYENAIFSYYKREYAQSVLCLLSAFEGVMLSYIGYDISSSSKKPSIPALIGKIKGTLSPFGATPMGEAHDMYRDTLATFLENWLYKNTDKSDFSLSVLNRHYVMHGMDAGNFYRPQDLHRLILAYDLLLEYLAFHQQFFYVFLPDPGADAFIDLRREYYFALAEGRPTGAQSREIERKMLRQHSRYIPPDFDPDIISSFSNGAETFALIGEMIKARSAREGNGGEISGG